MKKVAIFLITGLLFVLGGCDFFITTSQNTENTTNNTAVTTGITGTNTTATTTAVTTISANVDDVAYETLFDDSIYKKFIIYFSEENFLKLIDDMENYHDEFGNYRDNTIQEVDVTYIDGEGNVMVINEVGFRTKGNVFSRILPVIKEGDEIVGYQQVAFQLEFNETFDYVYNSTQYNSLKSREVFELEQLNFKHIRENDYGVVTESVAYDLYRAAGVVTSNTSYAIIYFDIEGTVVPYGLFMLQEPIDDTFVERYFGKNQDGTIGDLYKCTWQTEPASLKAGYESYSLGVSDYLEGFRRTYALKTNEDVLNPDFSAFTDFIELVNEPFITEYSALVSSSLDINSFAKAMAMGFLIGSADDIRSNANNYYLYFNNGYVYYMPFDMDNSLGFGWNPYEDYGLSLDFDEVQPSNYSWYGSVTDFVLVYNLFNDENFVGMYTDYLEQYISETGLFDYDIYEAEFVLIRDLYRSEIQAYDHLGISFFSLDDRWFRAEDYFTEKKDNIFDQFLEMGYY